MSPSRLECAAVHELFLERREKALGDGVVIAVTGGAHAAPHAVRVEQAAVLIPGVLATAVRVVQRAYDTSARAAAPPVRALG
jgi:hypothetical protein